MRSLVLTVDYEIFGNGTGDVRKHVTDPTTRMAKACECFGVPLTIYFEVEEYLAFCRERAALIPAVGYDPAAEIRQQLVELARRGHDLQLHLHPEWYGADMSDGRWRLRPDKSTVDSLFTTPEETGRYIAERKQVVDDILQSAGLSKRVSSYRAGAFCAQPGARLLRALAESGFVSDSSVVKGMIRRDVFATLDFRLAPSGRRHWRIRDDVARINTTGPIVEVPIYSRLGRRYQQLTPKRLMAKFSRRVPADRKREMIDQLGVGSSPAAVVRFLLQRFPIKLDFHNMGASQMLRWIRNTSPPPPGDLDVMVLIGHTKEHRNDRDFADFLAGVALDPSLEIISMHELSRRLVSNCSMAGQPIQVRARTT